MVRSSSLALGSAAILVLLVGCDDSGAPCSGGACVDASTDASTSGDAATDAASDASATCDGPPGLFVAGSCTTLAAGIRGYAPLYVLWSDGAAKARFVYLPPGTQIDTTDPDAWVYPVGTRLYKHFDLGGRHIETRLLEKVSAGEGAAAWQMRTFAWNFAQTGVTEVVGGVVDALGTTHDIPPQSACPTCHAAGMRDVSLSFTAIQLNHVNAGVPLQTLVAEGRLTQSIATTDAVVPGNDVDRAALGYLHANCGPCHNGANAPPTGNPLRFWVPVGITTVNATPTYLTAVDQNAALPLPGYTLRIASQHPETSMVVHRMSTRDAASASTIQMPPLATNFVDNNGVAAVSTWISTRLP